VADGTSDEQILADVVRRVAPTEVADRMVATFRSQISGYQRLPEPVVLGQIAAIARRNVELFFRSILEGQEPSDADLHPFRESAKDRAAEGMPLEDLLHAYRLGGRIGWQAVVAAAREEERPALLTGAERLMDYVDSVSAAVAQSYLDERQHLVSEEERRLRDLFDAIVGGAPLRPGLRELAETMGFPLSEAYRPFAETVPGAAAYEHGQMAAALRRRGVLALTEGDRVSGLAPPELDGSLAIDGALVAIADPTPRAELGDALEEVRLLVDLGRRLGRTGELRPEEHVSELLLARSPRLASMLRERALGALERHSPRRGSDLLDTLEIFLACQLDRRKAAERLHVHPNTLDYRLRRAEELTGLRLSRPEDLMLVALALKQRTLASSL
jgi:hypothetical protein